MFAELSTGCRSERFQSTVWLRGLTACAVLIATACWSLGVQAADPEVPPPAGKEAQPAAKQTGRDAKTGWPLVFEDDFEHGADRWDPVDREGWRIERLEDGNHIFHQHLKSSSYTPQHRSPLHQAYAKDLKVGSFVLEARVRSTHPDYGHRDACVFFGRENPSRLYYVHFGQKTDDHANQIFIVNDSPRAKISTQTNPGTPWDEAWHQVRIERDAKAGTIDVYFDDLDRPAMKAVDTTFAEGAIGIGSFDDTAAWDNVRIYAPDSP
ncbi:MAG: hypothetical protein U0795_07840 [Pirellulales bacterium]